MEEIWAALIQSAATVFAVGVAYVLGRAQGKHQTQHNESTRAVTELRRKAIEAQESLETCKSMLDSELPSWSEEDVKQAVEDFKDKVWELCDYYRAAYPWMQEQTIEKIKPLVWELYLPAAGLVLDKISESLEGGDERKQSQLQQEAMRNWDTQKLQPLLEELDAEARRLVGTSPSWLRRRIRSIRKRH